MNFFLTHQNPFTTQISNNHYLYGQGLELIIGNSHTSLYLCPPIMINKSQSISWTLAPIPHVCAEQGIVLIHPIEHLLTKRHSSMLLCLSLPSAVSGSTGNWTSLQIVQIYIPELSILVDKISVSE